MNEEFRLALERVDILNEELNRVKRALIAASNGIPFKESYNEEVYLEEKADQRTVISLLSELMEHLLKLAYCPSDVDYERNRNHWIHEVSNVFIRDLIIELGWGTKKPSTNLINYVRDNIEDAYDKATVLFKRDFKNSPRLVEVVALFPEQCPWTLEKIMDDSIQKLLESVPNRIRKDILEE